MQQNTLERLFAQSIFANAFFAALELGLFKVLSLSPRSPNALAENLRISPRGAVALLDAQVAMGLATYSDDGYAATEETYTFLNPESEAYCLPPYQQWMCALRDLASTLRSDRPGISVTDSAHGEDWQSYARKSLASWPEEAAQAASEWALIVDSGVLPPIRRVCYFAGGAGVFAMALAQLDAQCTVAVLDQAAVLPTSREVARRMKVDARCEFHPYSLEAENEGFTLQGANIAVFRETLHYFAPAQIECILRDAVLRCPNLDVIAVIGTLSDEGAVPSRNAAIDNIYMSAVAQHWGGLTVQVLLGAASPHKFTRVTRVGQRAVLLSKASGIN